MLKEEDQVPRTGGADPPPCPPKTIRHEKHVN